MKNKASIKILILIITIVILFTTSACFNKNIVHKDDLLNYYSDSANYKTYYAQIKKIEKNKHNAFSISICICNNSKEHTCNQTLSAIIIESNGTIAISNGFQPIVNEFYLLTLSTKEFTKNWAVPITAISTVDKQTVYLNFEEGKQNWIDYIQLTSPY